MFFDVFPRPRGSYQRLGAGAGVPPRQALRRGSNGGAGAAARGAAGDAGSEGGFGKVGGLTEMNRT